MMVGAVAAPKSLLFALNALSTVLPLLPDAERTDIQGLSLPVGIRAWSAAKADEYHRYTLAFNAIQNILAPIHCLPPEILSRIFVEAWQDRRSLRFTHVCVLWRTLLLDTSEFWAVAIARDKFRLTRDDSDHSDEDYLDAACLRSAPRHISLNLSSISSICLPQLLHHADRIASITVFAYTRDQLELLWKVLHAGMPCLEDLAIWVSDSVTGWAAPRPLSTGELPRLTRLTLPARLFRRSWPNTLQEIALRSYHENTEFVSPFIVSLEMVLSSLEDYPTLKVLDIRDNALFHDSESPPPSRVFPSLELLRIRLHPVIVSKILPLFAFPSSTRLDIRIFPTRDYPRGLEFIVPGTAPDAVAALVDHVTIASGPTSTICGLADGSERLAITANFDQWDPSEVRRTLHLFARTHARVSRLLVAQHPAQRMPITFNSWVLLPVFPHVTHLALRGRSGVCANFLHALWPPSPQYVLLPCLKDLTVGVATKRRSEISRELRRDGSGGAFVVIHFRECCRLFPRVLDPRGERGYRLFRLEFFSFEEGCMTKPDSVVSRVDLAAHAPELVEREIGPLRGLVDGPVVFSGYRFFVDA